MDSLYIVFVMMLTSGVLKVQPSPLLETTMQTSLFETTTNVPENPRKGEHLQKTQQPAENPVSNNNMPDHVIVPLDDIVFGLDQYTIVQFTNLQLSIPSELNLGQNDPDFSRMILNINSVIRSLNIKGDYSIFVYDAYTILPVSSQGYINMRLQNVSVIGETALALTPAALLALSYRFVYKPESIKVEIGPIFTSMLKTEERLSSETLKEPIVTMIKKQVDNHLNYYIESYINMILSKISVFTVGHKKEESFVKEPFNQNVQIGDLFDELLVDVRRVLTDSGKDEFNISSFYRNFSEKLESRFVSGNFSAEDGWISGLTSLKRFSNVSLSKTDDVFILSAGVEFDRLEMGYDKYKATFMNTQVTGEMDGSFLHTKMMMKISMNPKKDGTCQSLLSELRAFKMNGYRIKNITNIGSFDWLQRKINNWLIGYFQTKIVKEMEKELADAVHRSLNRFDCGDYLPHLTVVL